MMLRPYQLDILASVRTGWAEHDLDTVTHSRYKPRQLSHAGQPAVCRSGHQPEGVHARQSKPAVDSATEWYSCVKRCMPSAAGFLFAPMQGQKEKQMAHQASQSAESEVTAVTIGLCPTRKALMRYIRIRCHHRPLPDPITPCLVQWLVDMALLHHEHTIAALNKWADNQTDEGFELKHFDFLKQAQLDLAATAARVKWEKRWQKRGRKGGAK